MRYQSVVIELGTAPELCRPTLEAFIARQAWEFVQGFEDGLVDDLDDGLIQAVAYRAGLSDALRATANKNNGLE